MFEILTEKEKEVLNYYKKEYDKFHSNSLTTVQPKLSIKIIEDIPASLQSKGYLEIQRKDFSLGTELVSILLKDKFFEYFDINAN